MSKCRVTPSVFCFCYISSAGLNNLCISKPIVVNDYLHVCFRNLNLLSFGYCFMYKNRSSFSFTVAVFVDQLLLLHCWCAILSRFLREFRRLRYGSSSGELVEQLDLSCVPLRFCHWLFVLHVLILCSYAMLPENCACLVMNLYCLA